jgi:hypothetical protein
MKVRSLFFAVLLILASLFSTVRRISAQEATISAGLVDSIVGGLSVNLIGYGLTSIGLNSEAAYQTNVESQLSAINSELDTISVQLTDIQDAIQTQTCVDALSSSSVTNALTSIATVANTYTQLLQAGEDPDGSVSQADIDNFLNQVANGPSSGLPSMDAALNAINIALQSTNNDGIIGVCEKAVTSLPTTGSFGADLTFYSDPLNLLQYFADYQTMAALMLVEYYHYEAFLSSPYYSSTTISNNLPADEAAVVCTNPTGETATQCGFARDVTEEVYVYLQNQYSANGVPYSSKNSNGQLATGLYDAGDSDYYLFATSIEDFTSNEGGTNCPSSMTESNGCGITFSSNFSNNPFWSDLSTYYYETAWNPATVEMFRDVLDNFNNGSGSTTVADALSTVGLQNTSNKIILTQQSYSADPKVPNPGGTLYPIPGANAVCFMDTNLDRSFSMQPFCYNGSNDGVDYGNVGTTLWLWDTWNGGGCMTFRSINTVLDTNNQSFYGDTYTYDSYLNTNGDPSGCPTGSWVNSQQPGWLTDNDNGNTSANGFFWPSIDISTLACGSNLSYGLLQPAVARTANNSVGVPTMCGADFDGYFANIQPRNPYLQVAFTKAAVSGPVSSTPTLAITIQLQDVSSGTAVPASISTDTVVNLTSSSSTGTFSLSADKGSSLITSTVLPANNPTTLFYYGDTTAGTPQITADPGTMVPGTQVETITSTSTPSPEASGTADNVGSNKTNGKVTIKGPVTVPNGIQLQRTFLTIQKLLSEDAGMGELVRDAQGRPLQLPITPVTNPGGNAFEATYQTKNGATPRVRVKIALNKKRPTQGQLEMVVDKTRIVSPTACSGNPSRTQLHTRILADDTANPANPPVAFDMSLSWKCGKGGGKLTTP